MAAAAIPRSMPVKIKRWSGYSAYQYSSRVAHAQRVPVPPSAAQTGSADQQVEPTPYLPEAIAEVPSRVTANAADGLKGLLGTRPRPRASPRCVSQKVRVHRAP
jgi:hypothetical protein